MKKYILFLLLFFSNLNFSQTKDTIYGKVKSVREYLQFLNENKQNYKIINTYEEYGHFGFVNNKVTKNRFYSDWFHSSGVHYLNYYKEFDIEGKPTSEEWYYKNNDLVYRYEYLYNKDKKLVQEKQISSYDNSYSITNYSYNEYKKHLQSATKYWSDSPENFQYLNFIYNKKNTQQLIEENQYNQEGQQFRIKFVYDEFGRKKQKLINNFFVYEYNNNKLYAYYQDNFGKDNINEEYFYNQDGKLIETWRYRNKPEDENQVELRMKIKNYYLNDNLIKEITTTEKDSLIKLFEYKYDDKNRKIEVTSIEPRFIKNEEDILFEKTNINQLDIKIPKSDFIVRTRLTYKYDENYLTELIETLGSGKTKTRICKFKYIFDNKKNWIKQLKYVDNKKLYVWKRKINYY